MTVTRAKHARQPRVLDFFRGNNVKKIIVSVAAAALISTAASAAVTGDAASGWFVGKGDVQSAFGWNNATLQEEWASGEIAFHYDSAASYDVACEWDTGPAHNITHHTVNSSISRGLNASIAAEGRQRSQITGFILAPAGASGNGGDVPSVGERCGDFEDVDGNAHGTITAVTPLGSTGEGGLYVSWNGQDVLLQTAS